ncbi:MAG: hypothetical protein HXY25_09100 [Alphaproteobacteria bacterium]|nr:hypothetical protein [Alphaproteobacteria bacterium]
MSESDHEEWPAEEPGAGSGPDAFARPDLIPGYTSFFGAMLSLIPFPSDAAFTVVVLGVGGGFLAGCVKQFFPNTLLFLADPDQDRLDIVRARLKGHSRISTFNVDPTQNPLPTGADIVLMGLGGLPLTDPWLHPLYASVAAGLKPGGRVIVVDRFEGGTPALDERTLQWWITTLRDGDYNAPAGLAEGMAEGRAAPIAAQFEAMAQAGLTDLDVWYKEHFFAVLCADRP